MQDRNGRWRAEGASTLDSLQVVGRRDYLWTVGGARAAGLFATTGAGAAATRSAGWEAEADRRIAEQWQGTLTVQVVDEHGDFP